MKPAELITSAYGKGAALLQNPGVRVWGGYLLLAFIYTSPLYVHPTYIGGHLDWRFFHYLHESSRITLLEYGEFPLWNPWGCGGNVHLANAQTQYLSPLFMLMMVFGVAIGQKLFILFHFWIGMVGMHRLVQWEGRLPLAAVGSSVVFGMCGFFAMRAGGGHSAFLPFLYLPWLLLVYGLARQQWRYAVVLGLIAAETVLEGGIYPIAFFIVLLVFEAVYDIITGPTKRWRPVVVGLIAGAVFLSVTAVKFGPVLQFLSESPRLIPLDDQLDLSLLLKSFMSRSLERHLPGHEYVWHEYINYIGIVPLLAFFIMWSRRDEEPMRRWYYAVLVFTLIMIGDHGRLAPYTILHQLPIYQSLRVPSRFGILVVLHLALVFGVFINWLDFKCDDWSRRLRRRIPAAILKRGAYIVLVVVMLDMGISNGRLWWPGFDTKPKAEPSKVYSLHQVHGGGNDMWWRVARNQGTPHCYEANFIPAAKGIWHGRVPQVKLGSGAKGSVETVKITPNRWRIQSDITEPGLILVNQNYHRYWRLQQGSGKIVDHNGLLAIEVEPTQQQLVLRYWPDHLELFIAVSLCGLVASALALLVPWWRGRRRP